MHFGTSFLFRKFLGKFPGLWFFLSFVELGMVLVGCRCLTQVQPFECHLEDLSLKIIPSHFEPSLAPIFSAMNFCASQGACSFIGHFGTLQCRNWTRRGALPFVQDSAVFSMWKTCWTLFLTSFQINKNIELRGSGTVCIYENTMQLRGGVGQPSLVQNSGFQLHIARLVHSMHVAEGCSNGEKAIFHFAQRIVNLKDFLTEKPQWENDVVEFPRDGSASQLFKYKLCLLRYSKSMQTATKKQGLKQNAPGTHDLMSQLT